MWLLKELIVGMENNFESRETIQRKFKRFLHISLGIIIFLSLISLYQNEKWKYHKKIINENIPDMNQSIIYMIEYKYFSFKEMCWLYRVSTPTTNPVSYYEWNKCKNTIKKIDRNEY